MPPRRRTKLSHVLGVVVLALLVGLPSLALGHVMPVLAAPVVPDVADLDEALAGDGRFVGSHGLKGTIDANEWSLVGNISAGEPPRFTHTSENSRSDDTYASSSTASEPATLPGSVTADEPIVVTTSGELTAALTPANAGRLILVRAGDYPVSQSLVVPDGTTLAGEGVMLYESDGLPTGFAAGTVTVIRSTASVLGDLLTLGDHASVWGVRIEDTTRPFPGGNVVSVTSREAGDAVEASIIECELVNPSTSGIAPNGPSGRGLAVFSRNTQAPVDVPPHVGSRLTVQVSRSIIRSPSGGSGIFAINFAADSEVQVAVDRSVVGGGLAANGGTSRPDAVSGSTVTIRSHGNLYQGPGPVGWALIGGSGPPVSTFSSFAATERNAVRFHSIDDRIEAFSIGISAHGARRHFGAPVHGPSSFNHLEIDIHGTRLHDVRRDISVWAGGAFTPGISPGDGNTVRLLMRDVRGTSGGSEYGIAFGPLGGLPAELQGTGNTVRVLGSLQAFERTTDGLAPPPPEMFTAAQ